MKDKLITAKNILITILTFIAIMFAYSGINSYQFFNTQKDKNYVNNSDVLIKRGSFKDIKIDKIFVDSLEKIFLDSLGCDCQPFKESFIYKAVESSNKSNK